jgi:hypothetical protein
MTTGFVLATGKGSAVNKLVSGVAQAHRRQLKVTPRYAGLNFVIRNENELIICNLRNLAQNY